MDGKDNKYLELLVLKIALEAAITKVQYIVKCQAVRGGDNK